MSKTAYSYIRFSTKGQITGDSLNRQLGKARAYAKAHKLQLDESSFQDLGLSAFKGKNATEGALKAFLDAVDDGTIPSDTTLLIENFDRLSRAEVSDALDLFLGITKRGITIVTLSDEQVYSRKTITENWTKLIITLATMARAHEESAIKSTRVRSGKLAALADGKKHGKCPAWLQVSDDRRSFAIIEDRAAIVREVFKMRAESIGAHRIAKHLNTTYGWKWSAPQVVRLLMNPSVIGTRMSQAGYEPIIDYYPPIIDKPGFYDIQRLMSGGIGTKRGRRAEDEPNLFTGLLFCAHCDGRMRFFRATPNVSQRYVRCENALNSLCEAEGYVNYDALEKEVIGWLLLDQDEDFVTLLDKKPTRKVVSNAEVQSLKDQQSRLIDLAASGVMNSRMVTEKLNAIEMQIRHHEAEVVEPEAEERLFAEKAWALVERHDTELLAVADHEHDHHP
jgi:DNA invertase Pin-like site-specific DNA recombinase